jgi:hypothetical protein
MKRWLIRLAPALLTVLVVVLTIGTPGADGSATTWTGDDASSSDFVIPVEDAEAETYDTLYTLSTQAAVLTGYLTLVEAEDRPAQAGEAAELIHTMASQAALVEEDDVPLAETLNDLAEALDAYAAGAPAALTSVREASARNAELREIIRDHVGGTTDED